MKKRILSLLLCLVLCLSLLPTVVFAEDVALDIAGHQYVESALNSDISGTGWSWDVSENLLTLNGYDSGPIHINTTRVNNQTLRIKVNGTNTIHDQEDALELFSLDKSGTYEIFGTGTLNIGRKEEITYCLRAFDTAVSAACRIRDNVTIQISVINRSRQRSGMNLYGKLFLQDNARVSIEDDSSWGIGIKMCADLTLEGNSSLTVNNLGEEGQTGIHMSSHLLTIRDHATLSVVSEAGYGIAWTRDSLTGSMRLDGTGTVSISGAEAALYNFKLKETPVVEGDKYSQYNVTGSPSGKSVKYTFPLLINTVVLTGYETPKAGETAGQNLAKIKVPSTGGYDFRDIYWCNSSGRLDPNYKFVAGQKYWIVADLDHYSGYVFEKTCGATINGSSDLVDRQSPGTIGSGASSSYRLETVLVTVTEFLNIWIGDKPVTSENRYDVLHDGGSVQFLPNGSAYGCGGKTLVLNNLNLTDAVYHTNADGRRYMLTIADDINVVLIGENIIHPPKNGRIFWEDDNGSLDGVYIGRNMYVRFYGSGRLDVSVSRNNSAFFSDNSTVMLEDNVTMRLSGKYGFNSVFSGIEMPWLELYDNSKLYAYGLRDDNDKDGLAIYCPEIVLRDNAYLYAEYEWNEQAVYTWSSDYKAWASTILNIRGIRNQIGVVNTEWETLNSINTCPEDNEGKFRALEIRAGKPSVLFGDANGDGTVDSKDLSLLRKYMASYDYTTGTSTVAVQPGADANGDGTIDSKDLSLLRKYMASYDYTTGTSTVVLGPSK